MLIIEFKIKDGVLNGIIKDVEDWFGVSLTHNYLTKFLIKHTTLAAEIHNHGFDTVCRESFIDEFALALTGLIWPSHSDTLKVKKKFQIAFKKAVEKTRTIKLEKDWTFTW